VPGLTRFVADWGYLGIFTVVVLGNIGLPVPEETVLTLAGYLVWSGQLHLGPVIVVGTLSAVIGDSIGYVLGRRYGLSALERFTRGRLQRNRVDTAERLIGQYGALAVGVARFIGGLRFLAGPLAGAVGLPVRSFLFGNVLGAILFVPYAIAIGYGVGYGIGPYLVMVQNNDRLPLIVAAVVVILGVVTWRKMLALRRGASQPAVDIAVERRSGSS
jgi:membrane protein DedA with SNARE-associated domain